MHELFSRSTPSRVIRQLLLQGKNSPQIYLVVHDQFPKLDERKLRNLISVLKSKYKQT